MDITLYQWEDRDYNTREELFIDGKNRLHVGPLCECPEDAIIGRDLVDCSQVVEFMKEAWAAGKRGEPFRVVDINKDPNKE